MFPRSWSTLKRWVMGVSGSVIGGLLITGVVVVCKGSAKAYALEDRVTKCEESMLVVPKVENSAEWIKQALVRIESKLDQHIANTK